MKSLTMGFHPQTVIRKGQSILVIKQLTKVKKYFQSFFLPL